MQHLLLRLGEQAFAVAVTGIDAVLPLPELDAIAPVPAHLAGMLRYRGRLVPVLDLQLLHGGEPCQRVYSTRIILVKDAEGARLGLLAERVLDVVSLPAGQALSSRVEGTGRDWLDPLVFESEAGLARRVNWRALLTPDLRALGSPDE